MIDQLFKGRIKIFQVTEICKTNKHLFVVKFRKICDIRK